MLSVAQLRSPIYCTLVAKNETNVIMRLVLGCPWARTLDVRTTLPNQTLPSLLKDSVSSRLNKGKSHQTSDRMTISLSGHWT